jgi:hypothetical protein
MIAAALRFILAVAVSFTATSIATATSQDDKHQATHLRRSLQNEELVQARYLVNFNWRFEGIEMPMPQVEISCKENIKAVFMEQETLLSVVCESVSEATLRCANFSNFLIETSAQTETDVSVAMSCVGSSQDVLTLSASMPESFYTTSPAYTF